MQAHLFHSADNPLPDPTGERHLCGIFAARDGVKLRYAIFKSAERIAKGTVVLLHGRNESIEKYFETIRHLNERGLWVATFDWRGQGISQGRPRNPAAGYVRRFTDYEQDLDDFLHQVVLPDTRLPFFLIAHSTGGLVALSAAPRLTNRIERMVLLAPFIEIGGRKLPPGGIRALTTMLSLSGFGKTIIGRVDPNRPFAANPLTHDERRFQRNLKLAEAAPELLPTSPTARWISEAIATMRKVRRPEHLASIDIPTLILAAGADTIVPIRAVEELGSYFRAARVVTIDRARHELLQESDFYREQALAAIDAFIPGSSAQDIDGAT